MTGISRAGYYRWRVPPPSFPVEMELRDAMQQVALEFPAYGYRRITMELNRRGFAVNHKWNHCGDELQCAWLGGTLLRAPQVKLCVEIFATKFILDLGLSRDCHWFLPLQFANAPINRYRTRTATGYWKNLTAIDGGCLLVASPQQEFEGTQSGKRPELVDEMAGRSSRSRAPDPSIVSPFGWRCEPC
jgi:hypothetical protein